MTTCEYFYYVCVSTSRRARLLLYLVDSAAVLGIEHHAVYRISDPHEFLGLVGDGCRGGEVLD